MYRNKFVFAMVIYLVTQNGVATKPKLRFEGVLLLQCNAYSRAVCELLIILRPVKYLKVLLGFVEQCRLIRVAWYKSKKADDHSDLNKL